VRLRGFDGRRGVDRPHLTHDLGPVLLRRVTQRVADHMHDTDVWTNGPRPPRIGDPRHVTCTEPRRRTTLLLGRPSSALGHVWVALSRSSCQYHWAEKPRPWVKAQVPLPISNVCSIRAQSGVVPGLVTGVVRRWARSWSAPLHGVTSTCEASSTGTSGTRLGPQEARIMGRRLLRQHATSAVGPGRPW
jgi:hypothetical protein